MQTFKTAKWCMDNKTCDKFKVYLGDELISKIFPVADNRFVLIYYNDHQSETIRKDTKLQVDWK